MCKYHPYMDCACQKTILCQCNHKYNFFEDSCIMSDYVSQAADVSYLQAIYTKVNSSGFLVVVIVVINNACVEEQD